MRTIERNRQNNRGILDGAARNQMEIHCCAFSREERIVKSTKTIMFSILKGQRLTDEVNGLKLLSAIYSKHATHWATMSQPAPKSISENGSLQQTLLETSEFLVEHILAKMAF